MSTQLYLTRFSAKQRARLYFPMLCCSFPFVTWLGRTYLCAFTVHVCFKSLSTSSVKRLQEKRTWEERWQENTMIKHTLVKHVFTSTPTWRNGEVKSTMLVYSACGVSERICLWSHGHADTHTAIKHIKIQALKLYNHHPHVRVTGELWLEKKTKNKTHLSIHMAKDIQHSCGSQVLSPSPSPSPQSVMILSTYLLKFSLCSVIVVALQKKHCKVTTFMTTVWQTIHHSNISFPHFIQLTINTQCKRDQHYAGIVFHL